MTTSANTSSQVTQNAAILMGVNVVSEGDLLSELMSGLSVVEPVQSLSMMEQDILATLDMDLDVPVDVAPVTLAEAVEMVKEPKPAKKAAAPRKKADATEVAPVKKVTQSKPKAAPKAPETAPADVQEVKALTVAEDVQAVSEAAAEPAPAPTKPAPAPRMTFAKKSEKIAHKLGEKARDYLVLDIKDAELTDEALELKQATLLKFIDEELAVKVGEKAVMLFGYLRNGGKLNEIMRRTFTVLIRDGFLTSGAKGNLVTNFEMKPYSPGTSASQSNQMFALFPLLKICTGKAVGGRMEMNPDSTILLKMREELGL